METTKKSINRWLVLAALVLTWTMTFFSRFVWSPVITPAAAEVGMSMSEAGSLMSAFYFGYLFTQIIGGYLADKYKPKFWIVGLLACVAGMTFAMSWITSYSMAYAVRFICGFIGGPVMAMCSRILSDNFEPKERALPFAALMASPSLGTLLANLVGPQILAAYSWRVVFQVTAAIILAIAVLDIFVLKNPQTTVVNADKPRFVDGLKNYFTNKQLLLTSLAGFLFMAIPAGYSTWANKFMTSTTAGAGITATQAGAVMMVYAVVSVIGSFLAGAISKKYKPNPKYFIIIVFACACVSMVFWNFCRSYGMLLFGAAFFGIFSCSASGQLTTWAVNIGGNKYAATTTALQNLLLQASNVIFPTFAGSLIDKATTAEGVVTSYSGVWIMYAILLGAAALVMFLTSSKSAAESIR